MQLLVDCVPLNRTMPLKGTHSRVPSLRGRGLRLSGSCSKAASTQRATSSAQGVIVAVRCVLPCLGLTLVFKRSSAGSTGNGLLLVDLTWCHPSPLQLYPCLVVPCHALTFTRPADSLDKDRGGPSFSFTMQAFGKQCQRCGCAQSPLRRKRSQYQCPSIVA